MNVIAVGAGFSGSLMAILLGRQGCTVTVVDRYEIYPAEFCAEQLVAIDDVHGAKRCVSLEDGSTLI